MNASDYRHLIWCLFVVGLGLDLILAIIALAALRIENSKNSNAEKSKEKWSKIRKYCIEWAALIACLCVLAAVLFERPLERLEAREKILEREAVNSEIKELKSRTPSKMPVMSATAFVRFTGTTNLFRNRINHFTLTFHSRGDRENVVALPMTANNVEVRGTQYFLEYKWVSPAIGRGLFGASKGAGAEDLLKSLDSCVLGLEGLNPNDSNASRFGIKSGSITLTLNSVVQKIFRLPEQLPHPDMFRFMGFEDVTNAPISIKK